MSKVMLFEEYLNEVTNIHPIEMEDPLNYVYYTVDEDNAHKYRRARILEEYKYRVNNDNVLAEMYQDIDYGDPINYLTNQNRSANFKNALYTIAQKIIESVIAQDCSEYITDDLFIRYIYEKIPSKTSEATSSFLYNLFIETGNNNSPSFFLHRLIYEIITPEIFKEIKLVDVIAKVIEEEPAYFKKVKEAKIQYLPEEIWEEFLNKLYVKLPHLKRGSDVGLNDLKIK